MDEHEIFDTLKAVEEGLQDQRAKLATVDRRKTRPENDTLTAVTTSLDVAIEELQQASFAFGERRNLQVL